jgi:hypothetical protein
MHKTEKTGKESRINLMYSYLCDRTLAASAAMTTPTAAYSDMVTDWNEIAIQTFPRDFLDNHNVNSVEYDCARCSQGP